jgi:hypothetical protein
MRTITIDKGSRRRRTETERSPESIHEKACSRW